jgi:hypothetical protein
MMRIQIYVKNCLRCPVCTVLLYSALYCIVCVGGYIILQCLPKLVRLFVYYSVPSHLFICILLYSVPSHLFICILLYSVPSHLFICILLYSIPASPLYIYFLQKITHEHQFPAFYPFLRCTCDTRYYVLYSTSPIES